MAVYNLGIRIVSTQFRRESTGIPTGIDHNVCIASFNGRFAAHLSDKASNIAASINGSCYPAVLNAARHRLHLHESGDTTRTL